MADQIRTLRADENTAGNPPFPAAAQFEKVERSLIKGAPHVHSSIPRWGDRPGGAAVAPFAASAGGTPAARSVSMMDQVMAISERSARSPITAAGHAERVYSIAEGATPPSGVEDVSSSWQRSANKHGV